MRQALALALEGLPLREAARRAGYSHPGELHRALDKLGLRTEWHAARVRRMGGLERASGCWVLSPRAGAWRSGKLGDAA